MTSVPDDEDEDHDQIEEEEDIQSFSADERRSKSKQRKNATDVRYISLKPFFKKERKRQQQKSHFEAESAEIESNGAAPDDLDNMVILVVEFSSGGYKIRRRSERGYLVCILASRPGVPGSNPIAALKSLVMD